MALLHHVESGGERAAVESFETGGFGGRNQERSPLSLGRILLPYLVRIYTHTIQLPKKVVLPNVKQEYRGQGTCYLAFY